MFSLLPGKMMLIDVNRELYTWSAEEEVKKALEKWEEEELRLLQIEMAF